MKMTPKTPKVKDIKAPQSDTTEKFLAAPFSTNITPFVNSAEIPLKHDKNVEFELVEQVSGVLTTFRRSEP